VAERIRRYSDIGGGVVADVMVVCVPSVASVTTAGGCCRRSRLVLSMMLFPVFVSLSQPNWNEFVQMWRFGVAK